MECWHMNGAGNDFVVIDARGRSLDFSSLAVSACSLTGADGLMAMDHSDQADFKLHFYNSDGSRGEMCGNGSRCICRFAYERGLVGETMTVETDGGRIRAARLSESCYRVELNTPGILELNRREGIAYVELGSPGVPHCVVEVPGMEWTDRERLRPWARALRRDPIFPKGANVNFYTWTGDTAVRILTYERGVEDYTLACGTGSGSAAAVLWASGKLPGGILRAENPGGVLTYTLSGSCHKLEKLLMEGPTEIMGFFDI